MAKLDLPTPINIGVSIEPNTAFIVYAIDHPFPTTASSSAAHNARLTHSEIHHFSICRNTSHIHTTCSLGCPHTPITHTYPLLSHPAPRHHPSNYGDLLTHIVTAICAHAGLEICGFQKRARWAFAAHEREKGVLRELLVEAGIASLSLQEVRIVCELEAAAAGVLPGWSGHDRPRGGDAVVVVVIGAGGVSAAVYLASRERGEERMKRVTGESVVCVNDLDVWHKIEGVLETSIRVAVPDSCSKDPQHRGAKIAREVDRVISNFGLESQEWKIDVCGVEVDVSVVPLRYIFDTAFKILVEVLAMQIKQVGPLIAASGFPPGHEPQLALFLVGGVSEAKHIREKLLSVLPFAGRRTRFGMRNAPEWSIARGLLM